METRPGAQSKSPNCLVFLWQGFLREVIVTTSYREECVLSKRKGKKPRSQDECEEEMDGRQNEWQE